MIVIDEKAGTVTERTGGEERTHALGSPEGFALVSRAWLRAGWDAKHVYTFSWLGRPLIQLPEDMLRIQEAIYDIKPDVILETGVAHGGSSVFFASLCKLMGHGRVVSVDIEIRPHNRAALEAHALYPLITLIEGDSIAPETVAAVKACIEPGERVFAVLDAKHTKDHVLAELEAYAPLVPVGSYAVACDGIMGQVVGAPRTQPDWSANNPTEAAKDFAARHPDFVVETPAFAFCESPLSTPITYWPGGWLKRMR